MIVNDNVEYINLTLMVSIYIRSDEGSVDEDGER